MKVPEGVLKAYSDSLQETRGPNGPDPTKALEAALEQLREELEGDEAVEADAGARWLGINNHAREQSRHGLRAALNSVLGDKEKGR